MKSLNAFRNFNKLLSYDFKNVLKSSAHFLSTSSFRHQNYTNKESENYYGISPKDTIFSNQLLESLVSSEGDLFLDFTFGSGGHSQLILENYPSSRVIAVDRDNSVDDNVQLLKKKYPNRLCFLNMKFSEVVPSLSSLGIENKSISGAVIDCGPSFEQLYSPERGFSSGNVWPIDMRMDGPSANTASALDVIKAIDEESLFKILKYYGQHRHAKKLSYALVQARYQMINIRTPDDVINFVKGISGLETDDPHESEKNQTSTKNNLNPLEESPDEEQQSPTTMSESPKIHSSAVSVFRALRMLVNNEMNELDCAIKSAHYLLKNDAPLAVVSYNSLEDTIVKRHFQGMNIDASPSSIGKQYHRNFKVAGLVELKQCVPWSNLSKHLLRTKWNQQFKHDHWKSAILRSACKVSDVTYDS